VKEAPVTAKRLLLLVALVFAIFLTATLLVVAFRIAQGG